ncbi:MAG: DNA gyrase inhibitor YacG [Caulobacteraceae bacterium]
MTTAKCPICGKPAVQRFRPFCSTRCADVDLHRWLAGAYSIGETAEEEPQRPRDPDDENG